MIRPPRLSACLPSSLRPLPGPVWPFRADIGDGPSGRPMSLSMPGRGDALLVVDVHREGLPGGAPPTPAGRRVLAVLNRCIDEFVARDLPVLACRTGLAGAAFDPGLRLPANVRVLSTGRRPVGHADPDLDGRWLLPSLRAGQVRRLFIGGLATEEGVSRSALEALRGGLAVVVLRDAVAAREARPGDGERALARLRGAGARVEGSACWAAVP